MFHYLWFPSFFSTHGKDDVLNSTYLYNLNGMRYTLLKSSLTGRRHANDWNQQWLIYVLIQSVYH